MYILVRSENDYNQHGEYFVAWFSEKPTRDKLISIFDNSESLVDKFIFSDYNCDCWGTHYRLIGIEEGKTF